MEYDYKSISIYADAADNLLIIPSGYYEKYGGTKDIAIVNQLNVPYSEIELDEMLKLALEQCYSLKPDEDLKITVIEKFLNIKGYSKAVKQRRWIGLEWDYKNGYTISPTQKIQKRGYVIIEEKIIKLGHENTSGELAKAVIEAMQLSTP